VLLAERIIPTGIMGRYRAGTIGFDILDMEHFVTDVFESKDVIRLVSDNHRSKIPVLFSDMQTSRRFLFWIATRSNPRKTPYE